MALTKYIQACGKNTPGIAPELYLVEAAKIASVTETNDEISAVTMTASNKFIRVQADFDSVQVTTSGTYTSSGAEEQNLIFRLPKPTKDTEIFLNQMKGAVACGIVAIYVDGNRIPKAFGISAVAKEGKTRPVRQLGVEFDSGTLPTDENSNAYTLTLTRLSGVGPVPFNTALTTAILAGDATNAPFIDWT
jgi:hypothetical protein